MTRKEYFDLRTQVKSHFTHQRVKNQNVKTLLSTLALITSVAFLGLYIERYFWHDDVVFSMPRLFMNFAFISIVVWVICPSNKEIDKAEDNVLISLENLYKHYSVDEFIELKLPEEFFTD